MRSYFVSASLCHNFAVKFCRLSSGPPYLRRVCCTPRVKSNSWRNCFKQELWTRHAWHLKPLENICWWRDLIMKHSMKLWLLENVWQHFLSALPIFYCLTSSYPIDAHFNKLVLCGQTGARSAGKHVFVNTGATRMNHETFQLSRKYIPYGLMKIGDAVSILTMKYILRVNIFLMVRSFRQIRINSRV